MIRGLRNIWNWFMSLLDGFADEMFAPAEDDYPTENGDGEEDLWP